MSLRTSFETTKCIERLDHRVWLNQFFNILSQYICNLAIAPTPVRVFCMMPAKIHRLVGLATTQERQRGLSLVPGYFSLVNYVILALRRENPENENDLRLFLRSPLRILTAHNFTRDKRVYITVWWLLPDSTSPFFSFSNSSSNFLSLE